MSGLAFTADAARNLEKTYRSSDIVAQRRETLRRLNLRDGERVLDIGSGPGFLCEEMSAVVGPAGCVVGVDISPDLVALCDCRPHFAWLSYEVGNATELAHPDASFDVVTCTQVAEYVHDVDRLLSESLRVLRPGGRALFVATDWDAVVWYSDHPDRMATVMKSWEAHCAHPRLPRSMPSRMRQAGFQITDVAPYTILNLTFDDGAYSRGISEGIRKFVGRRGAVSANDIAEWHREFVRLSDRGCYFFSSNRYFFEATKPLGSQCACTLA